MRIKLDKRDTLFSKLIRERDGHRCVFCGRSADEIKLECSHFWSRANKRTRFDPLNCDALCFSCHLRNEGNKQGDYRDWKLKQLGEKGYAELEERARSIFKYDKHSKEIIFENLKESGLKDPYKGLV
jgi:hypothetical protein